MEVPPVCTIHKTHLINGIMLLCSFTPFMIPNEHISQCTRGQKTNPNDIALTINDNHRFMKQCVHSGCAQMGARTMLM